MYIVPIIILLYFLFVVQRSEALQAALAKRLQAQDPDMPAPFKRQSLMKRKPVENGTQPQLRGGTIVSILNSHCALKGKLSLLQ